MKILKKTLAGLTSFLLIGGGLALTATPAFAAEGIIPDESLGACVNATLGRDSATEITEADLKGIQNLFCNEKGVISLEGLQFATDLVWLSVNNFDNGSTENKNAITDLIPLANLPIEILEFNGSAVSDISTISTFPDLRIINAENNNISDISAFQDLRYVQDVRIGSNPITDLDPLGGKNDLIQLHIGNIDAPYLTTIITLPSLAYLSINDNNLTNISLLQYIPSLRSVNITNNDITSLEPLRNLPALETIYADNNNISSAEPLSNVQSLTTAYFNNNSITDVTPFSNLTNLHYLDLDSNGITDISPLRTNAPSLAVVNLDYNYITDISPLELMGTGSYFSQVILFANGQTSNISGTGAVTSGNTVTIPVTLLPRTTSEADGISKVSVSVDNVGSAVYNANNELYIEDVNYNTNTTSRVSYVANDSFTTVTANGNKATVWWDITAESVTVTPYVASPEDPEPVVNPDGFYFNTTNGLEKEINITWDRAVVNNPSIYTSLTYPSEEYKSPEACTTDGIGFSDYAETFRVSGGGFTNTLDFGYGSDTLPTGEYTIYISCSDYVGDNFTVTLNLTVIETPLAAAWGENEYLETPSTKAFLATVETYSSVRFNYGVYEYVEEENYIGPRITNCIAPKLTLTDEEQEEVIYDFITVSESELFVDYNEAVEGLITDENNELTVSIECENPNIVSSTVLAMLVLEVEEPVIEEPIVEEPNAIVTEVPAVVVTPEAIKNGGEDNNLLLFGGLSMILIGLGGTIALRTRKV